jgi:hypothetical protein
MSSSSWVHLAVRLCAWLPALSALVATRAALAEGERQASYDVPPGCASRSVWLAGLRARLPPLLRTHPLSRTLAVHIATIDGSPGGTYVGELTSTADAALGSSRSVQGATCEEVLDALSFMGALALERAASSATSPPGTTLSDPAGASAPAPAPKMLAAGVDELRSSGALNGARSVRVGAVAFALLQGRLTPGQPVALGVAFRFAWSSPEWQPLFLLGAYGSFPEEYRLESGGSARFEHWSTYALGCPWRFPQSGAWGLRPCLDLDVGRSSGAGLGVAGAQKHSAPWLSSGAQLRAEVALGDRVELGASAGAVIPFWHAHFFFLPDVQSFETPTLGLRAGSYASLLF